MFDLSSVEYRNARLAVQKFDALLMRDPNVCGVGVGTRKRGGQDTDEIALVVYVARKVPRSAMPDSTLLPPVIDVGGGRRVPVDVVEAGPFRLQANTAHIRPAQPGTSIGNVAITAGTFGAVVVDGSTGRNVILSNNHVLADTNRAPNGSDIVQPGPYDGGQVPGDKIGTLTRYVTIVPEKEGVNFADVAIATPVKVEDISMVPLNNVPAPSDQYPGVGLLFAGDGLSRSHYNPLKTALKLINANLPAGGAVRDPVPGLDVQKSGRTTERTTGRIQEINATIRVFIPDLGAWAIFQDQFSTTLMSQGGDSGSVAVTLKPQ
ncbi:S1 family peptidase [Pendulispora rubella]|uniref:S1 family peptidase n=1 Tax=Pendulispora rubella TaxID=2741070 RepID=A0ABZ2KP86_9BACT